MVLSTVKASLILSAFPSLLHESVAISQSEARSRGANANWLANQTESGSHKVLSRSGWADVVFAFHDKDELGPKMLARIAKNTGLKPKDI